MKKVYKLMLVCVVIASAVAVYAVVSTPENLQLLEEQRTTMKELHKEQRQQFRYPLGQYVSLTEEEAAHVETIVESDAVVAAVLNVLGEHDTDVVQGPAGTALYKCTSEEWVMQVVVDLETQNVMAVSMNKGKTPLIADPQQLVHIAEEEFHSKGFGKPYMKKVVQSNGDGEVVFLTEDGIITIKIDLEEGTVINLEKTVGSPLWRVGPLFVVLIVAVVIAVVIVLIERQRKSQRDSKENTAEPEQPELPQ
jgi:hypothetical protein